MMVFVCFSFCEQRDHALRFLDAHAGHRLVEQQQARTGGERHRHLELALLAVREVRRQDVLSRQKADLFQHVFRGLDQRRVAARGAPEAEAVAGMRLHRERDVVAAR